MAEVFGSSSSHTSWEASSVSPSPMASIMEEASCNMASDCSARTESGSIIRRITTTMDTVNTAPAATSTGPGNSGWENVHTSVMAARAAMVAASISWLNFGTPMPRVETVPDSRFAMTCPLIVVLLTGSIAKQGRHRRPIVASC